MVQFRDEDFAPLLEKFSPPTRRNRKTGQLETLPYVLFGHYLREKTKVDGEGRQTKLTPHLFMLSMAASQAQEAQVRYYVEQKRFRVFKWHLPHGHPTSDGRTPYKTLEELCQMYFDMAANRGMVLKTQAMESALEKELAAARERIAQLEAKPSAKAPDRKAKGEEKADE